MDAWVGVAMCVWQCAMWTKLKSTVLCAVYIMWVNSVEFSLKKKSWNLWTKSHYWTYQKLIHITKNLVDFDFNLDCNCEADCLMEFRSLLWNVYSWKFCGITLWLSVKVFICFSKFLLFLEFSRYKYCVVLRIAINQFSI